MIPFISFKHSRPGWQIDLMVDSGSQGNVIKIDVIPSNYEVNYLDKI